MTSLLQIKASITPRTYEGRCHTPHTYEGRHTPRTYEGRCHTSGSRGPRARLNGWQLCGNRWPTATTRGERLPGLRSREEASSAEKEELFPETPCGQCGGGQGKTGAPPTWPWKPPQWQGYTRMATPMRMLPKTMLMPSQI